MFLCWKSAIKDLQNLFYIQFDNQIEKKIKKANKTTLGIQRLQKLFYVGTHPIGTKIYAGKIIARRYLPYGWWEYWIINSPGVAGAVLQTPLLPINWLTE